VQLARRGVRSILIDGSGRAGVGVAYSTNEPAHLLNVRAEGMSAIADDPEHFVRRFEAEGGNRRGFAERRFFGRYLRDMLADAVDKERVSIEQSTAISARRDGASWKVELDDGSIVEADALALALGNQDPEPLRAFAGAGERFVNNPWGGDARNAVDDLVESNGAALLIGTGLTMVDLVLSLSAAGYQGRIVAVSRRGQIPRAHADFEPAPVSLDDVPQGHVGRLWHWLRNRSAEVGWRAAIDSLRPHSHALWQSLDLAEQRRFMRHARPWWDVHRHRIAPQVAQTVHGMVSSGQLEIAAGRIVAANSVEEGIDVEIRRRGSQKSTTERFAYVFNCTGPLHAMKKTRNTLLRGLLDAGEVKPDQLDIGLTVDENSQAGKRLWALGPLSKGRYWEIIAVPDIRGQAAEVAEDIVRELAE
jgi:uncharacterized NAD(P)/FAD-binding protein YdhS